MGTPESGVTPTRVVVCLSFVFGAMALVAAAFFLDEWRRNMEGCKDWKWPPWGIQGWKRCEDETIYVAGAALGVAGAVIQLLSTPLGLLGHGREKAWAIVQLVVVIVPLGLAFILPMAKEVWKIKTVGFLGQPPPYQYGLSLAPRKATEWKAVLYLISIGVDLLYFISVAIAGIVDLARARGRH